MFEYLCCDLWRQVCPDAQMNGGAGDSQHGVDIYGRSREGDLLGIQCKWRLDTKTLRRGEILREVELAEGFSPRLGEFVIATTARRAAATQQAASEISTARIARGQFPVRVEFWDDIRARLAAYPDLIRKYYSDLMPVATLAYNRRRRLDLWQEPPPKPEVLALLHWRTRLSRLYGSGRNLDEIVGWARHGSPAPRVGVVTGPGGAGKSRLAGEAIEMLWGEGWDARFFEPQAAIPDAGGVTGVLWVIDYPEEKPRAIRLMLRQLRGLGLDCPLRVLLLSRQPASWWQEHEELVTAHAGLTLDTIDVQFMGLDAASTIGLLREVSGRLRETYALPAGEPSDDQIIAWRDRDRATHSLPLFATAAAVHGTLFGEPSLALSGPQIVRTLVTRERTRLDGIGREISERFGFERMHVAPSWAARLRGLAAVADGISASTLRRLADERLGLSLPPAVAIVEAASQLPFWATNQSHQEGCIEPVRPDIFAAALLADILQQAKDLAPEWLWGVIEAEAGDPGLLDRIGRLAYDVSTISADGAHKPLIRWLVKMVEGDTGRATALGWVIEEERLPDSVLPLALAVGACLVERTDPSPAVRASTLTNYGNQLLRGELADKALPILREAVDLYRTASATGNETNRHSLARALQRLGSAQTESGDPSAAIETIAEAVTLLGQPPGPSTAGDRNDLLHARGQALNQLGLALAAGDRTAAEHVFREVIELYNAILGGPLPEAKRRKFEDAKARGLYNLSRQLVGRPGEALVAIQQSVEIRRPLSREVPWRYSRYLALSLRALIPRLRQAGLLAEALAANQEVTELLGKLLPANPAYFGRELLLMLRQHAELLHACGRHEEAARRRAAEFEIFDHLTLLGAIQMDAEALLEIGTSLGDSGDNAAQQGLYDVAATAYTRAIDLLESIRHRKPAVWDGRLSYILAVYHLNRRRVLTSAGERQTRINEYSQSIALLEDSKSSPGTPLDAVFLLAETRIQRAIELLQDGDPATLDVTGWEAAVEVDAPSRLGAPWPESRWRAWVRELGKLHQAAISLGKLTLADCLSEQIVEIAAGTRSHHHDEIATLADLLIRHGAAHCELGKSVGMAVWLREGIACAKAVLAAGKPPADSVARTLFLNNLTYASAWLAELTGEDLALALAADRLRDGLPFLDSSKHDLLRFQTLDTLAYVILLQARHEKSCRLAAEAVQLLSQALKLGQLADRDSLAIVRQRRKRAIELQREICGKPPAGKQAGRTARKMTHPTR
jgi:tetratricopeptide (TPR) repeat protein